MSSTQIRLSNKILKQTTIALLAVLFLFFFTSLGLPNSSQNYSQFLTGIVCERSDPDWCNRDDSGTILRVIETQESIVYRLNPISDSAYDDLVEIGSLNAANVLRLNSPYREYFKFHANLGGADITSLQLRVLLANSLFAVLSFWITYSVIPKSGKRWFLGVFGFAIVGGDFLPNSVSLAPIGMSSVSFLCAVALAASVLNTVPDGLRLKLITTFSTVLLYLFALIVALTRNDQMMLLGPLVVASTLPNARLLLKNRVNETKKKLRLFIQVLVVVSVVPGLLFVRRSGSWQVVPAGDPGLVGDPGLSLRSYAMETAKSPYYFALDFAPAWTDLFSSQVLQAVVGVTCLGIIALLIRYILTAQDNRFLFLFGATAYFYVVSYGIIWGPRAELRYLWNLLLGIMIVLLFSNDWSKKSSQQIRRLLTAGFIISVLLNLLALMSNFDTAKKFWWSDSDRLSGTIVFLITFALGSSLSATYVRNMLREQIKA